MNKQELYDYVMKSPYNTNPTILKQAIEGLDNNDSSSGDSGSGADEVIVKMVQGEPFVVKSDTVTRVADYAFYCSKYLLGADFPNAKSIGSYAFYNIHQFNTINAPNAERIGILAFNSSDLVTVNFPKVMIVEEQAFQHNDCLKSASFDSATVLESSAFNSCAQLENVHFPKLQSISNNCFASCFALVNVNFPEVTEIKWQGLHNCVGLEKADFGSLETIEDQALYGCKKLTTLIIRNNSTVCVAELTAFSNTPMLTGEGHIYVPASMYEKYRARYESKLATGFFDVLFRKIEDYPEICG